MYMGMTPWEFVNRVYVKKPLKILQDLSVCYGGARPPVYQLGARVIQQPVHGLSCWLINSSISALCLLEESIIGLMSFYKLPPGDIHY